MVTMLTSALAVTNAVIVWLALYIRKLHNAAMKSHEDNKSTLLKMVEKNTEAFVKMEGAITVNTTATKSAAETGERSAQRMEGTLKSLNENILRQIKRE